MNRAARRLQVPMEQFDANPGEEPNCENLGGLGICVNKQFSNWKSKEIEIDR